MHSLILLLALVPDGALYAQARGGLKAEPESAKPVAVRNNVAQPGREVVTLDPAKPKAGAVAVVGERILAVGSLEELKMAASDQPFAVDRTFEKLVIDTNHTSLSINRLAAPRSRKLSNG